MTPQESAAPRLFFPGPTEVRAEILAAMARPMMPHRGDACRRIFREIQPGLRDLFGTSQPVAIAVATATALMETGVRALPPGPLLCLVNGAFSARFARIASATGREVDSLEVPWGAVHDPDDVRARLRRRAYAGVTVVHCETSTGALQPLEALAAACDVPLVVDAVSSIGGLRFEMDRLELAFCCASSQKALALPPGIAFCAASPGLLASAAPAGSLYLDLREMDRCARVDEPCFTPALPQVYALHAQLDHIRRETMEARLERHRAMAHLVHAWAEAAGFPILAAEGFRSPTVTVLNLPGNLTGPVAVRRVERLGFTVGTGYGPLTDSCIRIGHMGDHTVEGVRALLRACSRALLDPS